jgi:UDP-N-acetylglucosamine transferase subunit ALG13
MGFVELCEELRNKTDKWFYAKLYEELFSEFKEKELDLLEIGVNKGGSILLWERYFDKVNITGFDKNPNCVQWNKHADIIIGHQGKTKALKSLTNKTYDIIIDDGSHMMNHQIISFEYLWPYVKEKGFYIIEDVETSYISKYINQSPTCVDYFKNVIDQINREHRNDIDRIIFKKNIIVVRKA